ncbi:right-handed parallel beta-helix repeat-containing protein [Egicoccus sp. AB-alg6-2]|uniref:right-handed parallel beta-helix repeat-containing protein n=1 Tax=Egicoccus sp. AB-alg6-2 TaxID=3242692 RepID=UPI00359EE4BD
MGWRRWRGRRTALGLGTALVLAGCSGGGEAGGGGDRVVVAMYDNFFEPAEVSVAAGTTVVFENLGRVPHNALDVDGTWGTELVDPDEQATVVLEDAGTYTIYCSLHAPADASGGMVATLAVGDGASPEMTAVDADTTATDARIAAVEPVTPTGRTRLVPEEYPTIQTAVDAAEPGDLVLVEPGVYAEQVTVTTPQIVVRGTDRNAVIVDGQFEREMGVMVTADGVAVENMTVRDVTNNGFYWDGVTGFRGSHLTSINAGTYGIYAFDSVDGVFEDSYASGSADGGYYVGQCEDCRTILNRVTAEWNGFGFSGTNASNSLYLVNSTWRLNGAGIVPNTLDSQRYAPSRGATIAGNYVADNGNFDAPVVSATWPAFGHGIVLAGGVHHEVRDNVVLHHPGYGIAATPNLHRNFWMPGGNVVTGNLVHGSGRADLATVSPSQNGGDCFADNDVRRTAPALLERTRPCDGLSLPSLGTFRDTLLMVGQLGHFPGERRAQHMDLVPEPGTLGQLPGGADAPVVPAVDVFARYDGVDLGDITRPQLDGEVRESAATRVAGFTVRDLRGWPAYFAVTGWFLPMLAIAALALAAVVAVLRRPGPARTAWLVAVAVPALLTLAFGWPAAAVVSLVTSSVAIVRARGWASRRRRWGIVVAGLATVLLLAPALVGIGALQAGVL